MSAKINLKLKLNPCEAPSWARSGHAQTIWGHLISSPVLAQPGQSLELTLSDGDRLAISYYPGQSSLVVYLFHGLGGDIGSDYIQRTAQLCLDSGHSVYLVNHRGCGAGMGLARHPYHSGRGEDVSAVIEWGRQRESGKKHLAIGFSLSGNALLCLLTGLRGHVLPDYAISVNAPINLRSSAVDLQKGLNRIYDLRFIATLRRALAQKFKRGLIDAAVSIPRLATLKDFDELYTAPAGNFKNADHYYDSCSTYSHLTKISIPTLLLTAANDPFVNAVDYTSAALSPSVHLHVESNGGHMGYLTRTKTGLGSHRWLDYALSEYIQLFASQR